MGDFASLEQLRNAPPGAVFRERRGAPLENVTMGGAPTRAEYRSASRALPHGPTHQTVQAMLDAIDAETRELDRMRELLEG